MLDVYALGFLICTSVLSERLRFVVSPTTNIALCLSCYSAYMRMYNSHICWRGPSQSRQCSFSVCLVLWPISSMNHKRRVQLEMFNMFVSVSWKRLSDRTGTMCNVTDGMVFVSCHDLLMWCDAMLMITIAHSYSHNNFCNLAASLLYVHVYGLFRPDKRCLVSMTIVLWFQKSFIFLGTIKCVVFWSSRGTVVPLK